jgi:hypothetical protein
MGGRLSVSLEKATFRQFSFDFFAWSDTMPVYDPYEGDVHAIFGQRGVSGRDRCRDNRWGKCFVNRHECG